MLSTWYLARGTGLVSMLLLTAVLVLGILSRSGKPVAGLPRFVTQGLHRNVSLLAVAFLTVHVVTVVLDPYALTGVVDVLVPFGAGYRPLYVGLGTLALDLVIALVVTGLLRHRIAPHVWKAIHWLAYAMWPSALIHGIGAGTDGGRALGLTVTAVSVLAAGSALAWRTSSPQFRSDQLVTR